MEKKENVDISAVQRDSNQSVMVGMKVLMLMNVNIMLIEKSISLNGSFQLK